MITRDDCYPRYLNCIRSWLLFSVTVFRGIYCIRLLLLFSITVIRGIYLVQQLAFIITKDKIIYLTFLMRSLSGLWVDHRVIHLRQAGVRPPAERLLVPVCSGKCVCAVSQDRNHPLMQFPCWVVKISCWVMQISCRVKLQQCKLPCVLFKPVEINIQFPKNDSFLYYLVTNYAVWNSRTKHTVVNCK